uniref:Uncharacterized protein n=1 Tax=Romanomermis culicivorax TaxID=13658 RepID=A0A915HYU4_ROMCU
SDGSIDGGPPLEIIRRQPVRPPPDQFLSESEADDDDSVDNLILPPLDDDQKEDGDIDIENMPDEDFFSLLS